LTLKTKTNLKTTRNQESLEDLAYMTYITGSKIIDSVVRLTKLKIGW